MFRWFSKRPRPSSSTTAQAPAPEPAQREPVMREIPPDAPPAAPASQQQQRPALPPGARQPETPPPPLPPLRAIDGLIAHLDHYDADIRVAAARELGRAGDLGAVDPLVFVLRDAHHAVRVAAANALGKLHAERAVDALAAALSQDEDSAVQAAARGALQAIGTARAEAALAAHDAQREQSEREAEAARREQAAREAAERDNRTLDHTRGIEGLIDALRSGDERLHAQAADALAEAGPAAVEPVAALLGDANVWVRARAAELLGRIGDARAAEPLRGALDRIPPEDRSYESYQFRDAARRALGAVTPAPDTNPPGEVAKTQELQNASEEVSLAPAQDPGPGVAVPAQEAAPAVTVDPELARLGDEDLGERLLEIARAALGGGRPPLDSYDARRAAARSIGEELHRRGGVDAMRHALDTYVGDLPGRHPIDQAWDGLGEWMG